MEENRRISWTDLFIKVILVIVFVLFTVWLLSLSNKGVSNSLNVLTDNIFAENIDRMKEVGKDYFTTERLPKKIGEIETITLEEMYKKKLILEVKDKNGNACDAKDSYVSVEKMENEYQMKVNLECEEEEEYIVVIMGCYDYCDTDICEKKEDKAVEYEYSKTTGGRWSEYGNWSEWSKVAITSNNYRQVETKKVTEEYTYEEIVERTIFDQWTATCPSGYSLNADGTKCVKANTTYDYEELVCADRKNEGLTFIERVGLTCKYTKTVTSDTEYELVYVGIETGSNVPADDDHVYVQIDYNRIYDCKNGCQFIDIYTYQIYKKVYKTYPVADNKTLSCPSGYSYDKAIDKCSKSITTYLEENIVKSCPVDYKLTSDGTKCYKDVEEVVMKTGTKEVTYYRYRVRQFIGGTTDYKWSKSKNDQTLLNAGYRLTGRTR